MAQTFASMEERSRRTLQVLPVVGRLINCVYVIPADAADDLVPARGTVMPESQREGMWDGDNIVLEPRLRDWKYGKQRAGAKVEVLVQYIQCLAY